MDRVIIYPGAIPLETDLLATNKNAMIGLSKLALALFGTGTLVNGFATTPTGPASLQVVVAPGEIYSLQNIDGTAYSSIAADTTHSILKQGISLDSATLSCPAPTTTGQSINYLIQVAYQDVDAIPVVLPYYNASNPSQAYSGPANNGVAQNTRRNGAAVVSVKAGVSAATGTQTTPSPDVGYVGLFAVTVAFAQTTITSGSIAALATQPQINSTLHGLSPTFLSSPVVPPATAAAQAMQFGQVSGVTGQSLNMKASITAVSASATFTADELVVETALGGLRYCIASLNKTINLGTTGAGGMDTGTAPASGFVAVYAILNTTTGATALLATNATSVTQAEIYSGANMPAGYNASALIAILPTTSASQLAIAELRAREVTTLTKIVLSVNAVAASLTTLPVASTTTGPAGDPAIPRNAKFCKGYMQMESTATTAKVGGAIASTTAGVGQLSFLGYGSASSQFRVPLINAQAICYSSAAASGTPNATIITSGYEF